MRDLSARAVLKEAADCGVRVSVDGGRLSLKAAQKPPQVLLDRLQTHKAEILALLRHDSRSDPGEAALERAGMTFGGLPETYPGSRARLSAAENFLIEALYAGVRIRPAGGALKVTGRLAPRLQAQLYELWPEILSLFEETPPRFCKPQKPAERRSESASY